jgi:hypothetical protein
VPLATISPLLALLLTVLVAPIVIAPVRLFGRWLERKGSRLEHDERDAPHEPSFSLEQKPYDPFAT